MSNTATATRTNRYAAPCVTCGQTVPAEAGSLDRGTTGWEVRHIGACPAAAPQEAPQAPEVDALDLNAIFDGLVTSKGDARTTVYVAVPDGDTRLKLKIDRPRDGDWAGFIFVKDGAVYGEGRRYGTQRPGQPYRGQVQDALRAVLADREAAFAAYGRLTNHCGICNRVLEDAESVARGIGPQCFANMGG